MATLRILFLGDVVGEPGLRALRVRLPALVAETGAALVVANGENTAGGMGITPATVRLLLNSGVQVITTGNHVWDKSEMRRGMDDFPTLVRPANYPPGAPGRGWCTVRLPRCEIAVANLSGRIFIEPMDCPFRGADQLLAEVPESARVILVDFHAEATSEKRAMGFHLAGRATAVVGTHTHVATADAQVLPGGTGYITDVGMTGVGGSVIGLDAERALKRFRTGIPRRHVVAEGEATVCGALIDADPESGRCHRIERVEWAPGTGALSAPGPAPETEP